MKKILFPFLLGILFLSCIETPNSYTHLPPGQWRGYLKLTEPELGLAVIEEEESDPIIDYFELPFNFEVAYENEQMVIHLLNGDERLKVEESILGRDPATAKDTISFNFSSFDTTMDGFYEENTIEGYWNVTYKGNYKIPFLAEYGKSHRFTNKKQEAYNFDGDWDVVFNYDDAKNAYKAVGEFKQNGNDLLGTFRTETGDYRYLEGNAYGDKLRLSVFDGSHAFLFAGSVQNDTIYGEFRSGSHYKTKWKAHKAEKGSSFLKDPYKMTAATNKGAVDFSFPNTEGVSVQLSDDRYKGKVKLINIMGTWCPNCRDEIIFLKEVRKKYPQVEIVTMAFEKYRDSDKALDVLKRYKKNMGFEWPLLLGGYADKGETAKTLPFLDKIYSYPTLLTIDGDNKIIDIHTGFNGPATSKYAAFEKEFNERLQNLLNK